MSDMSQIESEDIARSRANLEGNLPALPSGPLAEAHTGSLDSPAYRRSSSFGEAVRQNLLLDVSPIAKRYGLKIPAYAAPELWSDLSDRLPGEMSARTAEERLEIVVAQTVSILKRSQDSVQQPGFTPFTLAVRRRAELGWTMTLSLLAEPRPREIARDGQDLSASPAESRNSRAIRLYRRLADFEPYRLWVCTERDQSGAFGIVLALQEPFRQIARHV